jgi:acetylornithine deacetylase/succinyl-diaminopimelate desuccinylase-like protein
VPDRAHLRQAIAHLAAIDRPSASPGEREAAEWIAAQLAEFGCTVQIEEERAHGG